MSLNQTKRFGNRMIFVKKYQSKSHTSETFQIINLNVKRKYDKNGFSKHIRHLDFFTDKRICRISQGKYLNG